MPYIDWAALLAGSLSAPLRSRLSVAEGDDEEDEDDDENRRHGGGGDDDGDDGDDDGGDDGDDGGDDGGGYGGGYGGGDGDGDGGDGGDGGWDWGDSAYSGGHSDSYGDDSGDDSGPYGDNNDDNDRSRRRDRGEDDSGDEDQPRSYYDRTYNADGSESPYGGTAALEDKDGSSQPSKYYDFNPESGRYERNAVPWGNQTPTLANTEQAKEEIDRDLTKPEAPQTPQSPQPTTPAATPQGPLRSVFDETAKQIFQRQLARDFEVLQQGKATRDNVPLLSQIVADWKTQHYQQTGERRAPNEDDPRDMANFRKYAEDWIGVAADRNDEAKGLSVGEVREKAYDPKVQEAFRLANAQYAPRAREISPEEAQRILRPRNGPIDAMVPKLSKQSQIDVAESERADAEYPSIVRPIGSQRTLNADMEDADYGDLIRERTLRGRPEVADIDAPDVADENGVVTPHPSRTAALNAATASAAQDGQDQVSASGRLYGPMVASAYDAQEPEVAPDGKPIETPRPLGPLLSELRNPTSYAPLLSQVADVALERPLDAASSVILALQDNSRTALDAGGTDGLAPTVLGSALSALVRNPSDPGAQWAAPALEMITRMAFASEYGRSPQEMPLSYAQDWLNSWKAGEAPPLAEKLDTQLREIGAWTPGSPLQRNWKEIYTLDITKDINQSDLIRNENFRQQMDRTLTQKEAEAVCGPVAAVAFARANGSSPTLAEAVALAREVGWNSGGGMNGIGNQIRLLARLGVDAEAIQSGDAFQIARAAQQELSQDKPIIISSGAHYWVATSYNTQTGKFFVGATGRALGGADDMTLAEMDAASRNYTRDANNPNGIGLNGAVVLKNALPSAAPSSSPEVAAPTISAPVAERPSGDSPLAGAGIDFEQIRPSLGSINVFNGDQSARREAAEKMYTVSPQVRRQIFESAMEQGLGAEGVPQEQREYWKDAMRRVVIGEGESQPEKAENRDLNPFIMSYERPGRIGTARENAQREGLTPSSASGYFQFVKQHPDGSPYGHEQYLPEDARPGDGYDPRMQVRQFIRAIKQSAKHRGDPMSVVMQKRQQGWWGP